MEWNMLKESKKLFPHWLDKSDDSNFTKHLKILNNQQTDIRHKLKTVEWSRLLNKPLQIHKTQREPYKWKIEFEANVPRLKQVNIYKNPTIYNNEVINTYDVIDGYFSNNSFYKHHNTEITNLPYNEVDEIEKSFREDDIKVSDKYMEKIEGIEGKYYYDLKQKQYYKYENGLYQTVSEEYVPKTSLIYSESFIDNYSHFFRHILYENNKNEVSINRFINIEDDIQKYKTTLQGEFELQTIHVNTPELYFNLSNSKYTIFENNEYVEVDENKIIYLDCDIVTKTIGFDQITSYTYYYMKDNEKVIVDLSKSFDGNYYIFTVDDGENVVSKIPYLIEQNNELVVLTEDDRKYKTKFNHTEKYINDDDELEINVKDNGKFELTLIDEDSLLCYNITDEKYYLSENEEFVALDDDKVIHLNYDDGEYYYINSNDETITVTVTDIINENEKQIENRIFYIITETDYTDVSSRIPLIETEDISPLISTDKYVMEVRTWNDYHFLKGYPEIDFIDYNNNNIIDVDERNYDNLNIEIETIGENEYLTFRVHQFGIKLIEIFKDDKPIHKADFVIEKLGYSNKSINDNFAHIYNYNDNTIYYPRQKDTDIVEEVDLDVNKYVWRILITDDDKIKDDKGNFELKNKYDIQVTYYDSLHPYDSEYDKILRKTYVCEDSIFYHDMSLDMLGSLYNVHRHVFRQPYLETYKDKIEFYNHTYPTFCNTFSEDDYHYQKRLEYYINNYNKIYFPCLELWKYFHIDSKLINRKVIVAEQNYSYLRTLNADEDKYINELGKNKAESFQLNNDYRLEEEEASLRKPKLKALIDPNDYINNRNGILVDEDNNYIKDTEGTPVQIDYQYTINEDDEYVIKYETLYNTIFWYNAQEIPKSEEEKSYYQIRLTDALDVVPNTNYQLRFCLKKYPLRPLNVRVIYKNDDGDVQEVVEYTPSRKDYVEDKENNELIYSDYKKEWEVLCEYICTDFLTLNNARNIEICLESEKPFKISDVTLQRITINHFDTEYMKTNTDYNSCVYDLYADYNEIPSNIKYEDLTIFNKILNRSLPLTKIGYFNFVLNNTDTNDDMNLRTETNIYINDMLDIESVVETPDNAIVSNSHGTGIFEYTYDFKKYVKQGNYEITFVPYTDTEKILFNLNIDLIMSVFTEDNHSITQKLTITNLYDYYDSENKQIKIPFMNKSDNTLQIRMYYDHPYKFKDFKLKREAPLTMEELTQ